MLEYPPSGSLFRSDHHSNYHDLINIVLNSKDTTSEESSLWTVGLLSNLEALQFLRLMCMQSTLCCMQVMIGKK